MSTSSLLTYWKESIDMFTSKSELKLYILGTLATFKRSLTILIKKLWWIYLFIHAINFAFFFTSYSPIANTITDVFVTFMLILIARPSLERKDINYLAKYQSYIWPIFFMLISPIHIGLLFKADTLLFTFFYLTMLFFLDSTSSIRSFFSSLMRGLKCMLLFFPAMAILSLFGIILFSPIGLLIKVTENSASSIFFLIIMMLSNLLNLIFISSITVLHTKLKHKHYSILIGRTP